MKKVWMCRWETIPGDGEHTEQFSSLGAAKQAMRQKISQCIDLDEYLSDLEPQVTNFLGQYLSDPQFPKSKLDIPQYYEEPDRGELILDASFITWDYPYDAFPRMHTDLVLEDGGKEEFAFDFWYEYPEEAAGNGVHGLSIRIHSRTDYGTSAYPLMILRVLNEKPQNQAAIIRAVYEQYEMKMDRKAVSRNLELLTALGFCVQKSQEGYYIEEG